MYLCREVFSKHFFTFLLLFSLLIHPLITPRASNWKSIETIKLRLWLIIDARLSSHFMSVSYYKIVTSLKQLKLLSGVATKTLFWSCECINRVLSFLNENEKCSRNGGIIKKLLPRFCNCVESIFFDLKWSPAEMHFVQPLV